MKTLLSLSASFAFLATATAADMDQTKALLKQYCVSCHSGEKPKGDFNIVELKPEFANKQTVVQWQSIAERMRAGEMPPKDKDRPKDAEIKLVVNWIDEQIRKTDREQGRVALRRLNRVEYENTVRDLLGIEMELKELLPLDSSANGFDNNSEAQHVSSFLMEKYLDVAEAALNVAIANQPKPNLYKKRLLMKDERHVKVTTEKVFRISDEGLVMFSSSAWQAISVGQFYPSDRGRYRFRISMSAVQSKDKPVTLRVDAGTMLMAGKSRTIGHFDAPPGATRVVEFTEYLEARQTIRMIPYGLASAQTVNAIGADKYEGAGIQIHWVEVEGPLHDSWPPDSHKRIFGDLAQVSVPAFNNRARVEVGSKTPEVDIERVLKQFATIAFRRPVTDEEIAPIIKLAKSRLNEKYSFEQAVRVGLKAIMVSPNFLYLQEKPGKLDDYAIANRLSYFLWNSPPDAELLAFAAKSSLSNAKALRGQVERMLKDPKAKRFTENFTQQWLGLREIDFTEPSFILYPEYDHLLKISMLKEAELFFAEVLKHDLSMTEFVSSDFAMLNARLAKHYNIPNVDGWEFQKVKLPADSHRGGVMTMAGVLKVTANGTSTSPVMRGAFILDKILGTPPPKPPADVPGLEPDIRGANTIRDLLAKHRSIASCASCHVMIDPPGFALESFDVIGGWRDNYRTTGRGERVEINGRKMNYLKGPKVDPSDVTPAGDKFKNIDEYKQILLKDREKIARSLTKKLLTYATGQAPSETERGQVDTILKNAAASNYGLKTIIQEIVVSSMFQTK